MGYFADRNVVRNKSREGRFEKISGYENRNKRDTGQTQKGDRDGFIHDRDLLPWQSRDKTWGAVRAV